MATIFDISLLNQFSAVFVWLFIWVLFYAVLQTTKILGANKNLDALIAVCAAFFFALSPALVDVVRLMTPWFIIFILLLFFVWLLGMFIGMEQSELRTAFGKESGAFWWIFSLGIIIVVYATSKVFGQSLLEEGGGNATAAASGFGANVMQTLFDPKILGLALLLIIASFVVRFMATND